MKIKNWIALAGFAAIGAAFLASAPALHAANCTGPIVAFTTASTCDDGGGGSIEAFSQGLIGQFRALTVNWVGGVEPTARARGLDAGGAVKCSVTDDTAHTGPSDGTWLGCPASAVNQRLDLF